MGHPGERGFQPAFAADLATWVGANATMAAWLYEQAGQRVNRAMLVSAGNTAMCAATSALILWYRL